MLRASATIPSTARPLTAGACWHLLEEVPLTLPFWRYHGLFDLSEYSFLLDSAKDPERLGRFSFVGGDPFLVYRAKRRPGQPPAAGAEIETRRLISAASGRPLPRPVVTRRVANPFDDLPRVLAHFGIDLNAYAGCPAPLLCGAVGYIGYEAGYFVEPLPDRGADDLDLPDIYLMFVDSLLAHCHETGKSYLSIVGRAFSQAAARQRATEIRDALLARLEAFDDAPPPERKMPARTVPLRKTPEQAEAADVPVEVKDTFDEAGYCRAVAEIKEHIYAGDVFEACMTHRLESPLVGGTPWELYEELRRVNPAPFAAFLNFPEAQVICSSPERYVSVSPERIAESRPIKGTRPRGETPERDAALRQDLLNSTKDRAENVMIVDLVRNDFGRVCKFRSVQVPELMVVEDYATVFQMVSTIRGELDDGRGPLDLVRATFPPGSMTGAPKIEAMKIIDSLEPVKRGIYSGSIGYFDFAGHLDLNVAIRTFVVKNGRCYYNVGGAVVADSDPLSEYQETMHKARALKTALANLKAGGRGQGSMSDDEARMTKHG